jgi:hypothetical protein
MSGLARKDGSHRERATRDRGTYRMPHFGHNAAGQRKAGNGGERKKWAHRVGNNRHIWICLLMPGCDVWSASAAAEM